MIYFDVRPSAHLPTVELRICDACPRLEDVVLLAGLFRSLVIRESNSAIAGHWPAAGRTVIGDGVPWRGAAGWLAGVYAAGCRVSSPRSRRVW